MAESDGGRSRAPCEIVGERACSTSFIAADAARIAARAAFGLAGTANALACDSSAAMESTVSILDLIGFLASDANGAKGIEWDRPRLLLQGPFRNFLFTKPFVYKI